MSQPQRTALSSLWSCSSRSSSSSNTTFQCLRTRTTPSQRLLAQHQQQQSRSVSSNRRTQKALRVQPHESFSKTSTNETRDHIIFNPPSSAPNVYHTPLKFLPPNDPRRKLHSLAAAASKTSSSLSSSAAAAAAAVQSNNNSSSPASSSKTPLPPPVRPTYEKKYHLSADDVAEIRRLRAEDPRQWTRVRLAEKFGCSQFFVSLCATAPHIAEERKKDLEQIKKRWGRAKTEAREDRQRRKELWGRE